MANKTLQDEFSKAWEAMLINQWHFFTESGKAMDDYMEVLKEMDQPEKGFIHVPEWFGFIVDCDQWDCKMVCWTRYQDKLDNEQTLSGRRARPSTTLR